MNAVKVTLPGRLLLQDPFVDWLKTVFAAVGELKTALDLKRNEALLQYANSEAGAPLKRLLQVLPSHAEAIDNLMAIAEYEDDELIPDGISIVKPTNGEDETHWGCVLMSCGPVKLEVDVEHLRLALRPFEVD